MCCFSFGYFLVLGDALLFYEVACKCVIKIGVLARCEMFFFGRNGGASVLGCRANFVCINWDFVFICSR